MAIISASDPLGGITCQIRITERAAAEHGEHRAMSVEQLSEGRLVAVVSEADQRRIALIPIHLRTPAHAGTLTVIVAEAEPEVTLPGPAHHAAAGLNSPLRREFARSKTLGARAGEDGARHTLSLVA